MKIMRRTTITAMVVVLVMLFVLVFRHAVGISQARDAAEIASHVADSWTTVGENTPDFRKLGTRLRQASASLDRARSNMFPGLQIASWARNLPVFGNQLGLRADFVLIADDLFDGGVVLAEIATDLDETKFLSRDQVDGLPKVTPALFEQLRDRREELVLARDNFESARTRLESVAISDSGLDHLWNSDGLDSAVDLMDSLISLSLLVADHGPDLFGYEGDARYIIVAVNADELRAGGGFSPGFWDVQISDGKLLETVFYDSFEVSASGAAPATPPIDMLRSMWAGGWFFPDAAWYPDTARTTSFVSNVVEQGVGISDLSAVIYADQWAALSVMSVIGEVTLDDGRLVDENSFFELLQERTDVEGRKYLSTIFDGLLNSFSTADSAAASGSLLLKLFEALESRHMQVHLTDQDVQNQFAQIGIEDVLTVGDNADYLFVTDSNVGFSKVNRNISRELRYEIDFTDRASPRAALTVTHRNRSVQQENENCEIQDARVAGSEYVDSLNACFWNLGQVYTSVDVSNLSTPSFPMPEGALYRTVGYDDVEDTLRVEETDKLNIVSGLFTVAPGETISNRFEYDLPGKFLVDRTGGFEYRLRVPKQAGLRNSDAIVEVKIPKGYGLEFANPAPLIVSNGRALFEEPQDKDLEFRMIFSESAADKNGRIFRPVPKIPGSSVVAFADLTVFGSVESSRMTSARITPRIIRLAPGESMALSAIGVDQNGRRIDGTSARWILNSSQVGSVDRRGVFTASFQTGTFRNAIEVTVSRTDSFGTTTATNFASVEIFDPELDILDVVTAYPPEIRALPSQLIALRAIPWTVGGRIAKDARIEWRVDEAIGTIDSFGFLRVSGSPGIYTDAVSAVATQPGRDGGPDIATETSFTFIVPSVASYDHMARATVLPRTASLRGGQSFRFVPRAFTDRAETADNVEWRWILSDPNLGSIDENGVFIAADSIGPAGAEGLLTAVAMQRIDGDVIEIETVSTINLIPPVVFQPLDFAEITSGTVNASKSDRVLLTASGYSESGLRLPNLIRQWSVVDPRAGRIQSGSTYVAGRTAGTFEDAIQLRLIQRDEFGNSNTITLSADVIIASDIDTVVISPIPDPLARGQTIKLDATAFDIDGRVIPGVGFVWHVMDPEAGVVRPGGVFTAGLIEGDYTDVLRVYAARGR